MVRGGRRPVEGQRVGLDHRARFSFWRRLGTEAGCGMTCGQPANLPGVGVTDHAPGIFSPTSAPFSDSMVRVPAARLERAISGASSAACPLALEAGIRRKQTIAGTTSSSKPSRFNSLRGFHWFEHPDAAVAHLRALVFRPGFDDVFAVPQLDVVPDKHGVAVTIVLVH